MEDLDTLRLCSWPVASLPAAQLSEFERQAASHGAGSAVVSSCQRIEVLHRAYNRDSQNSCDCGAPRQASGQAALLRLASVAAGLDSLVLGEEQVMGQVRTALAASDSSLQSLGGVAVAVARQLRSESEFQSNTGHLLDRALRLAGLIPGRSIAVAGAGTVGRLVAARGVELGYGEVTILGRRDPEGRWFDSASMRFVPLDELASLGPVDVLVTCLGAGAEPLGDADLPAVRNLVIDLGTPRNVDAPAYTVLTIAMMLQYEAGRASSDEQRIALHARLRELLDKRLALAGGSGRESVGRLRFEVERLRLAEVERIGRLHPDIERETVDTITRSLVQQIFHRPTTRLRELDDPELGARLAALFAAAPEFDEAHMETAK